MPGFSKDCYKYPLNPFALSDNSNRGQCKWYAFGRIYELTKKKLSVKGHGEQWYDSAPPVKNVLVRQRQSG